MSIASIVGLFLPVTAALSLLASATAQGPQNANASKSAANQPAGGVVVGVIDVVKAVEQYPRYIKLRGELEASIQQYEEQLKEMSARGNELRGTIQVLAEGSQERADKEFEYKMLLQTQDYRRKAYRDRMQLQDLRNTLAVYEDLEYVIGVVAKRKGVSLVLSKRALPQTVQPIAEMSPSEVQGRVKAFDERKVWFASKELDLTGDVIKELMIPVPDRNSPERAPKDQQDGKE
ncbi:MAG: OmpH family outer membrane protein [Planctomycetota bacterium]